jgi:hypothetical protein
MAITPEFVIDPTVVKFRPFVTANDPPLYVRLLTAVKFEPTPLSETLALFVWIMAPAGKVSVELEPTIHAPPVSVFVLVE